MHRSRTIERNFQAEGSERSLQLGAALAMKLDPELLETLINTIGALQEFGGDLYIGAACQRYDRENRPVSEGGRYETYAYVVGYTEKSRVKGQDRPDEPYAEQPAPEVAATNGDLDEAPELAEVEAAT